MPPLINRSQDYETTCAACCDPCFVLYHIGNSACSGFHHRDLNGFQHADYREKHCNRVCAIRAEWCSLFRGQRHGREAKESGMSWFWVPEILPGAGSGEELLVGGEDFGGLGFVFV